MIDSKVLYVKQPQRTAFITILDVFDHPLTLAIKPINPSDRKHLILHNAIFDN
jgi:hypothetical protein